MLVGLLFPSQHTANIIEMGLSDRKGSGEPLLPLPGLSLPRRTIGGAPFPPLVRRAALFFLLSLFAVAFLKWHPIRPPTPRPPRASSGRNETLTAYLDTRWPAETTTRAAAPNPHIWLTLSSGDYIDEGTAALGVFVERLNGERAPRQQKEWEEWGVGEARLPETVLVVLCLDDACEAGCERRDMWCYSGFRWNHPEQVSSVRRGE